MVTALLRGLFDPLGESGGGGRRCSGGGGAERLLADRVDLQGGVQKARPRILPKVKVTVIEVGKFSYFRRKQRGKGGGSTDQGISQEPKIINDIQKENPA